MAYFLILPLFVLWLVLAALAVAATRLVHQLRPAFPYVWRVALWASLGAVVTNVLLVLAAALGIRAADAAPASNLQDVTAGLAALSLLVGPFVASVVGWLLGAVAGLLFALRQRKVPPNNSSKPTPLRGAA